MRNLSIFIFHDHGTFLWSSGVLYIVFQFSLNENTNGSLLMYHGQLTISPHLLLFSLGEVSFATEPQQEAWGRVSTLFFLPIHFCPLFMFLQAFTLTKPLLCEPTAHRVTFLPVRRLILGILRMLMQLSFLFHVKPALPTYIINVLVLLAHCSLDHIFVCPCEEMKLVGPFSNGCVIYTNHFTR